MALSVERVDIGVDGLNVRLRVDGFGGLERQVAATATAFRHWREIERQFDSLRQANADRANRLDYLNFQIDELDGIALTAEAVTELDAEQTRLSHAERLLGDSGRVLELLDDSDPSLQQLLGRAADTVRELGAVDGRLGEVAELLDSALIQVDEATTVTRWPAFTSSSARSVRCCAVAT